MATLSALESGYIVNNLIATAPGIAYHSIEPPASKGSVKVGIETIIITAVVFIAVITWFEVLRSLFDNIFSDEPNYKASWIRILYAIIVAIIAIFLIKFIGKEVFKSA